MSVVSGSAVIDGRIVGAWANKGVHDHVVALTTSHIVTSGDTRGRRGSRRLIDKWNATAPDQWEKVKHSLPIEEVLQIRSSYDYSRITVSTADTVLTMRGFKKSERASAAKSIAAAAGLARRSTVGKTEQYSRPDRLLERFDGDTDAIVKARPEEVSVRSLFWALHVVAAFWVAGHGIHDVAYDDSLVLWEAVLTGVVSVVLGLAGIRFLMMRLTMNDDGILIVNFWRRHTVQWADVVGVTTVETLRERWNLPVVVFGSTKQNSATVTNCWTKARAQRIARLIATQVDSRTDLRSSVYADDLMFSRRPTSATKGCLHAGSL